MDQSMLLQKLGIESLNPMQEAATEALYSSRDLVVLSPTGSGKTLAFLLPLLTKMDAELQELQCMIIAPTRELAIQIEQVARKLGTGLKVNCVYGGRAGSEDKLDLKQTPALLVGTPGRVADHLRRGTFNTAHVKYLVLDEFDKSLEIGFTNEMSEIVAALPQLEQRVLTSATNTTELPEFVGLKRPEVLDFLDVSVPKLTEQVVVARQKDKLDALYTTLCALGNEPVIVFCNFKDTIRFVSEFLDDRGIEHGTFHGDLEQRDRELSLIKFRNGTHQVLLATDLAARGIDVPEIKAIVHYQLPPQPEGYTHRNGRTARMNQEGTVYVLKWKDEELPEAIGPLPEIELPKKPTPKASGWTTLYITAGRRDKVSKGDIAGWFFKQGNLQKGELGGIELTPGNAFAAVLTHKADECIAKLNNTRLKKKKVRVSEC